MDASTTILFSAPATTNVASNAPTPDVPIDSESIEQFSGGYCDVLSKPVEPSLVDSEHGRK